MHPNYIGITGFETIEEIIRAKEDYYKFRPSNCDHRLMIGILLSQKTLKEKQLPKKPRYPSINMIPDLLYEANGDDIFTAIHYNSKNIDALNDFKDFVNDYDLENLIDGIQLNFDTLPEKKQLDDFIHRFSDIELIMQLNQLTLASIASNRENVSNNECFPFILQYFHHVLIDMSRGTGKEIDVDYGVSIYQLLKNRIPSAIGFAGGLNVDNIREKIFKIRKKINSNKFNIDIESGIRDDPKGIDKLNTVKMTKYIQQSLLELHDEK